MTMNDIIETRKVLQKSFKEYCKEKLKATERARIFLNEHLLPAEENEKITDEEMATIYAKYAELCKIIDDFDNKLEISSKAIFALITAEDCLGIASCEGVWKES